MAQIQVYQADDPASLAAATAETREALLAYNAAKSSTPFTSLSIAKIATLIGIDDAVYRQIEAAIKSDKRHLMLYGPPGTGKTELAREIAAQISSENGYVLVTGSADWTSQDLIGGYQPMGAGKIAFVPGIMLRNFDRPIIIDELNRCDIDKVLGPMFTVLSKHSTTLPYRVDVSDRESEQYQIFGTYQPGMKDPKFSPTPNWRIIATINTIDKASLYQMSYALSRRFAWVFIDAPKDVDGFLVEFLTKRKGLAVPPGSPLPLAAIWRSVNAVRSIGPAPFIDAINQCLATDGGFDFAALANDPTAEAYLDAFMVCVMPLLDGVLKEEMRSLGSEVAKAIGLTGDAAAALETRMVSLGL